MTRTRTPASFLPLPPLDFQVLTLLATGARHGYGVVQAAEDAFPEQPPLDVGSLYRIVARMLGDGLIREVDPPAEPHDRRVRRYYATTTLGRAVVVAEAARMRALLASPATLRLLGAAR